MKNKKVFFYIIFLIVFPLLAINYQTTPYASLINAKYDCVLNGQKSIIKKVYIAWQNPELDSNFRKIMILRNSEKINSIEKAKKSEVIHITNVLISRHCDDNLTEGTTNFYAIAYVLLTNDFCYNPVWDQSFTSEGILISIPSNIKFNHDIYTKWKSIIDKDGADYDTYKWGMPLRAVELLSSTNEYYERNKSTGMETNIIVENWEMGEYNFVKHYLFFSNQLRMVAIFINNYSDSHYLQILKQLNQKYGVSTKITIKNSAYSYLLWLYEKKIEDLIIPNLGETATYWIRNKTMIVLTRKSGLVTIEYFDREFYLKAVDTFMNALKDETNRHNLKTKTFIDKL